MPAFLTASPTSASSSGSAAAPQANSSSRLSEGCRGGCAGFRSRKVGSSRNDADRMVAAMRSSFRFSRWKRVRFFRKVFDAKSCSPSSSRRLSPSLPRFRSAVLTERARCRRRPALGLPALGLPALETPFSTTRTPRAAPMGCPGAASSVLSTETCRTGAEAGVRPIASSSGFMTATRLCKQFWIQRAMQRRAAADRAAPQTSRRKGEVWRRERNGRVWRAMRALAGPDERSRAGPAPKITCQLIA